MAATNTTLSHVLHRFSGYHFCSGTKQETKAFLKRGNPPPLSGKLPTTFTRFMNQVI
jgi:hypothetical protein